MISNGYFNLKITCLNDGINSLFHPYGTVVAFQDEILKNKIEDLKLILLNSRHVLVQ